MLGEGSGEASCNGGYCGKDYDLEICLIIWRLDTAMNHLDKRLLRT